jgi:hypothetical protein
VRALRREPESDADAWRSYNVLAYVRNLRLFAKDNVAPWNTLGCKLDHHALLICYSGLAALQLWVAGNIPVVYLYNRSLRCKSLYPV